MDDCHFAYYTKLTTKKYTPRGGGGRGNYIRASGQLQNNMIEDPFAL
jgi:hypothetical protein